MFLFALVNCYSSEGPEDAGADEVAEDAEERYVAEKQEEGRLQ